jgi:hypothetical protein
VKAATREGGLFPLNSVTPLLHSQTSRASCHFFPSRPQSPSPHPLPGAPPLPAAAAPPPRPPPRRAAAPRARQLPRRRRAAPCARDVPQRLLLERRRRAPGARVDPRPPHRQRPCLLPVCCLPRRAGLAVPAAAGARRRARRAAVPRPAARAAARELLGAAGLPPRQARRRRRRRHRIKPLGPRAALQPPRRGPDHNAGAARRRVPRAAAVSVVPRNQAPGAAGRALPRRARRAGGRAARWGRGAVIPAARVGLVVPGQLTAAAAAAANSRAWTCMRLFSLCRAGLFALSCAV